MITVKSKNQFGEEILVNTSKIAYAIPSLGEQETVIFFDSDTHLSILEPFAEFKQRFATKTLANLTSEASANLSNDYPAHLPRLPNGNVDKRTNQYKEYMTTVAHHPV
jgi:hypothetical protein